MNELKPCPFCGRKAELGHTEKDSEYGKTAFVYCTNCGANGKMIEISPKYGADEKAIEAWNRRVNEDAPTADVVERKKGWIPCSEKLPEVRQWVLCQCRAGIMDVLRLTADGSWSKNYPRTKYMSCFVVAWMPLPEPYQSSIEEKADG